MSEPRLSDGLGSSQGQGSTRGQTIPSGSHWGGVTFGGSSRISSVAGPSQPSHKPLSEQDMDSAATAAWEEAQGAQIECCTGIDVTGSECTERLDCGQGP